MHADNTNGEKKKLVGIWGYSESANVGERQR